MHIARTGTRLAVVFVFAVVFGLVAEEARADPITLEFVRRTTNTGIGGVTNPSLEGQLTVVISKITGGVQFEIKNANAIDSEIGDIWFNDDDGIFDNTSTLPTFVAGSSSAGVDYGSQPGSVKPPSLHWSGEFYISPKPPPTSWGISEGEHGVFTLAFAGTNDWDAFVASLYDHDGDGTYFGLALHVISIGAPAGSDTYEIAPVPEPGTIVLLGIGGLGLAVAGRRRRKSA